jgi:hypothetical protein
MQENEHRQAWDAYRRAVEDLYDRPLYEMAELEEGDMRPESADTLAERAEAVIESSRALGEELVRWLDSGNGAERELARV